MIHFVARGYGGRPLWTTVEEGLVLWTLLVTRAAVLGLVLMPDHVHVLVADERALRAVREALRAYALWRNRHRGERGPVFAHRLRAVPVRGNTSHRARTIRYLALNPCRAGLTGDPLAWPLSTYRDLVGLTLQPVVPRARDPERLHAAISADPSVDVSGSPLPPAPSAVPVPASPESVLRAVAALARCRVPDLARDRSLRRIAIAAATALSDARDEELAALLEVAPRTIRRHRATRIEREVAVVRRVLGDPRFTPLPEGDLSRTPEWRRYLAAAAERRRARERYRARVSGPSRRRPGTG